MNKIANSAYRRANLILRSFHSPNIWTLMKAYKAYVRPTLEYATTIWNPYLIRDKTKIERVQRYFTRKVCRRCSIPYVSYKDRLFKLNLRSLEYRRSEFDLMFLYKMLNNLLDLDTTEFFSMSAAIYNTRSHNKRICSKLPLKTLGQSNYFSNRTAPIWNLLPSEIVTAPTYSIFHKRLKYFNLYTVVDLLF